MRCDIKKLLRESLEGRNVGYRSGDLNKKAETRFKMNSNRSTGHFGTGYYFFGDKEDADKYEDWGVNRLTTTIKLDGYNFAKASYELHNMLKDINYATYLEKDETLIKICISRVLRKYNAYEPIPEHIAIRSTKQYNEIAALPQEQQDKINADIKVADSAQMRNDNKTNDLTKYIINYTGEDSASTIVMKSLGFDGVDARGTELDNSTYGSVLYDA